MVKAYQRFEESGSTGMIVGTELNTIAWRSSEGKEVLVATNDQVICWNLQSGTRVPNLSLRPSADHRDAAGEPLIITALCCLNSTVAVGYCDGSVRVFDISDVSEPPFLLSGHRSAVTSLLLLPDGQTLVSGSKDTDLVVWDLVARAGSCRLRGHTDQVTCVVSVGSRGSLVSGSKDTLLKVWDIHGGAQICMQTAVAGNANEEVWSLCLSSDESLLAVGGGGARIALYSVIEGAEMLKLVRYLDRESTGGLVSSLFFTAGDATIVAAASGSRRIEVWKHQTGDELDGKQKRKLRKKDDGLDAKFTKLPTLFAAGKIKSLAPGSEAFALALNDNSLQLLSAEPEGESRLVSFPGHREAVRHVEFSADDSVLMSLSSESLRIWNAQSLNCVRSVDVAQGVVGRFLAGNRFALIATKTGELVLFDIHAAAEVYRIAASDQGITALERVDAMSNDEVFATVGNDKMLRFWLVNEKGITLKDDRLATLADEGLCLAFGGEKVVVGMLDSTLQIFHLDTLNPHLTLYGHKLPVTCVQFVSDGSLVLSGSADKSIKVWSPKFGNCLKSFKAHDGTITKLALIPGGTHLAFSTGRDGELALWDFDRQDPLVFRAADAHRGEAWGLALASDAAVVVSCGADRAIKRWVRSDEQLFAEEERDRLEELQNERELANSETAIVIARPSRKTVQSVRTADRLIELLPSDETTPLEAAKLLTMIPPADLAEVLLAIPATSARVLLAGLADMLESLSSTSISLVPVDTLLSAGFTLVQAQARYLVAEPGIAPLLARLRAVCQRLVAHRRQRCAVTAAAASFQLTQAQKRKRTA